MNDGSTDHTKQIVESFLDKLRITYIEQSNKGRSAARNVAIENAKGEIILFNDDDRIVTPQFLNEQIKTHDKPNIVALGWKGNILTFAERDLNIRTNHLYDLLKKNNKLVEIDLFPEKLTKIIDDQLLDFENESIYQYIVHDAPDNFLEFYEEFGKDLEGFRFKWLLGTTANMSVRREFLDEAGYFDENYKGWGMEDTDLVYRLQKNKGTIKNK